MSELYHQGLLFSPSVLLSFAVFIFWLSSNIFHSPLISSSSLSSSPISHCGNLFLYCQWHNLAKARDLSWWNCLHTCDQRKTDWHMGQEVSPVTLLQRQGGPCGWPTYLIMSKAFPTSRSKWHHLTAPVWHGGKDEGYIQSRKGNG